MAYYNWFSQLSGSDFTPICIIRGTFSSLCEGNGAGVLQLWRHGINNEYRIYASKTAGNDMLFAILPESTMKVTKDTVTISELMRWPFGQKGQTVQVTDADPNELQLFIEKMPASIKERMQDLREGDSQRRASLELERQLRDSQQREENSQRQLREMVQREGNLARQLRELQEREQDSQRQLTELQQREENCQRQLTELQQRVGNSQRQLSEMGKREENLLRQLRELQEREQNSQRQLTESQQREENCRRQLTELQQREENYRRQLTELQQREGNSQRQLREMQQSEENLLRQLRELQGREQNSQRQLTELQQREENSQGQLRETRQQLTICRGEVSELRTSLSTAQQTINEFRSQRTRDWVIPRDEIQITEKSLGKGGWGIVSEGTYCGCTVAVKQIHELILSDHNIHLFEREMNIASMCRHPHLLQFIGATNDEGTPLFLTELMEKSLRKLLVERKLSETEIAVISLDVALALNYLHRKKPEPIIHRDVSSANVLLWRQGDQWRGKVSDYGTANFMQQTMTVAPGNVIYSAPEALTSNQTVKIDVYSFGALLCEMCTRQLPDPRRRNEQVVLVTNGAFRDLVRRCLQMEPGKRPTMQEIIVELKEFDATS